MLVDQFEEMVEQSAKHPLVCNISIHPYVFGYPFRLRPLRKALKHCFSSKFMDRVWKCRPGDISDYLPRRSSPASFRAQESAAVPNHRPRCADTLRAHAREVLIAANALSLWRSVRRRLAAGMMKRSLACGRTGLRVSPSKGVVGWGCPSVAMGLLVVFMPPPQAAAVLVVPSLVTNIWQLAAGPRFTALAKRFATMMAGVFLGTFIGVGILTGDAVAFANGALGAVLVIYGVLSLLAVRFNVAPRAGALDVTDDRSRYRRAHRRDRHFFSAGRAVFQLAQARARRSHPDSGLSFTVSTIALGLALGTRGVFGWDLGFASLLALVSAVIGMFAGQRLRRRIQPEIFRRWFLISLVVLGVYMIVRAVIS